MSRHVAVAIHVTDVAAVVAVEDVVVVTTVEFLNRKPSDHADLSSSFIITRTFTTFVPDVLYHLPHNIFFGEGLPILDQPYIFLFGYL